MAPLSQAEVRQYHDQGFPAPSFRLPAPMVDGLRNALDRLLHDNPGVRREKRVSAHLTRRDGRANDEGVRGQADVLALARNEQILDPVQGRSGVPVAFATRPLWLLRGRDRSGRNDFHVGFEPGGC